MRLGYLLLLVSTLFWSSCKPRLESSEVQSASRHNLNQNEIDELNRTENRFLFGTTIRWSNERPPPEVHAKNKAFIINSLIPQWPNFEIEDPCAVSKEASKAIRFFDPCNFKRHTYFATVEFISVMPGETPEQFAAKANFGSIRYELMGEAAPTLTRNFIALARTGFFDGKPIEYFQKGTRIPAFGSHEAMYVMAAENNRHSELIAMKKPVEEMVKTRARLAALMTSDRPGGRLSLAEMKEIRAIVEKYAKQPVENYTEMARKLLAEYAIKIPEIENNYIKQYNDAIPLGSIVMFTDSKTGKAVDTKLDVDADHFGFNIFPDGMKKIDLWKPNVWPSVIAKPVDRQGVQWQLMPKIAQITEVAKAPGTEGTNPQVFIKRVTIESTDRPADSGCCDGNKLTCQIEEAIFAEINAMQKAKNLPGFQADANLRFGARLWSASLVKSKTFARPASTDALKVLIESETRVSLPMQSIDGTFISRTSTDETWSDYLLSVGYRSTLFSATDLNSSAISGVLLNTLFRRWTRIKGHRAEREYDVPVDVRDSKYIGVGVARAETNFDRAQYFVTVVFGR